MTIGLFADPGGTTCEINAPPLLGTTSVYIILKHNSGSVAAQFAVLGPTCPNYVIAQWSVMPGFLSIGEPVGGVQISLASCHVGDVAIMRIDLLRIGDPTSPCCALRFGPHPESESGMVEVFDCTMPFPNVIPVPQPYAVWLEGDDSCAPVDAPSNPSPADGATDVPLNATLTCELHEAEYFSACVPLGYEWAAVDFGTTPDPPPAGVLPYAPRGLVPGTTYHWRVNHKYFAAAVVSSPVWSFTTTTTPNPTEASTWGRIKAFYRR